MIWSFQIDEKLEKILQKIKSIPVENNLRNQENDQTGEFFYYLLLDREKKICRERENTGDITDFFHQRLEMITKKIKILCTDCNVKYKQNWHRDESSRKVVRIIIPLENFNNSGIEFHAMPPITYKEGLFYLIKQDIMHRTWCNRGEKNRKILIMDFYNTKGDLEQVVQDFKREFHLMEEHV